MQENKTNTNSINGLAADESPLLRLATRPEPNGKPYLDGEQFAAGELLRRDFDWALLSPKVTSTYARAVDSGGRYWQISDNAVVRLSDRAIAARERVFGAFDAVGPELSGIVYHVCCLAGGIEAAERHLTLPRRAGKAVLSLALTRLARHYGIKKTMRQAKSGQMGHWSAADARPTIMPMPRQHQP